VGTESYIREQFKLYSNLMEYGKTNLLGNPVMLL
jgi:hypothetical protein